MTESVLYSPPARKLQNLRRWLRRVCISISIRSRIITIIIAVVASTTGRCVTACRTGAGHTSRCPRVLCSTPTRRSSPRALHWLCGTTHGHRCTLFCCAFRTRQGRCTRLQITASLANAIQNPLRPIRRLRRAPSRARSLHASISTVSTTDRLNLVTVLRAALSASGGLARASCKGTEIRAAGLFPGALYLGTTPFGKATDANKGEGGRVTATVGLTFVQRAVSRRASDLPSGCGMVAL